MSVPRWNQFVNDFLSSGYTLLKPESLGYERELPVDYIVVLKTLMSPQGKMVNGLLVGRLGYDPENDMIYYAKFRYESDSIANYYAEQATTIFDLRTHFLDVTCP